MHPEPVTLRGKLVRLEPLELEHVRALSEEGLDPDIWELNPRSIVVEKDLRSYVSDAIADRESGISIPFAIVENESGQAIGSTRYANMDSHSRRLEIGWTWIFPSWQRTGVNTECKLLLLTHAFEKLGCARVELKTDTLNQRSRDAILRLGAKEEGIFRKHVLTYSGRWRDTVYYAILDDEWPVVKQRLLNKTAAYG